MSRLHRLTPEYRLRLAAVLAVVAVLVVCGTLVLGVSTYFRLRTQIQTVAALSAANRRLAHDVTQQNAKARYDDCQAGDRLRAALYAQALASSRTTPLLLRLVPSLDTPEVRRLAADSRTRQLKAYLPRGTRGCAQYALAVVPPRERASFHVLP
ncbi:MAG TPA: hypothetical protein VFF79_12745 [Conexibacter sp.]|jgi:hypothetical protein|nr:hypothetical protein [Conexibacter sp.]